MLRRAGVLAYIKVLSLVIGSPYTQKFNLLNLWVPQWNKYAIFMIISSILATLDTKHTCSNNFLNRKFRDYTEMRRITSSRKRSIHNKLGDGEGFSVFETAS